MEGWVSLKGAWVFVGRAGCVSQGVVPAQAVHLAVWFVVGEFAWVGLGFEDYVGAQIATACTYLYTMVVHSAGNHTLCLESSNLRMGLQGQLSCPVILRTFLTPHS